LASGSLTGIDAIRLGLLAKLVHSKRIAKIEATMPVTCSLLGDTSSWDRRFARDHRAVDARHVANALQFYRFLLRSWRADGAESSTLTDVAFCEIALVMLTQRPAPSPGLGRAELITGSGKELWARRARGMRLREVTAEAGRLLVGQRLGAAPSGRPCVALTRSRRTGKPAAFAIDATAFELVRALRYWQCLGLVEELSGGVKALVDLEAHGIIDLRLAKPQSLAPEESDCETWTPR
jgi:hypothetical protein